MYPLTSLVAALALTGATGCATRGYVTTKIDERAREIERQVNQVERGLEDTTVSTGRNTAQLREVDQTATGALETATGALETATAATGASREAQMTATDATTRAAGLEAAGRRLLFEVILTEAQGRFGFGEATLPEQVSAGLDALVTRVRSLKGPTHLEIEGHTDATGSAEFNAQLALRRAEAVRRYLHEHHRLPLHKINVISYGEERPVAPNDTLEGRANNRRVVVRVLG
jgi:outer membrane protein OmpA-like peptidoglycan-associated protein